MIKKNLKKLETQINQWSCIIFTKNSNTSFFPLGSCCQSMAVTSLFSIGCIKRQHAVILESIWETDLNITHFPVQRTGRLTPLPTCLPYFSLLLGQNYSKSNSLSPFYLFGQKNFLSPTPLLSWRKFSKSNSSSLSSWTKLF